MNEVAVKNQFQLNETVAIDIKGRTDRLMARILAFSQDAKTAFVEIRTDIPVDRLHPVEVTPPVPIFCAFCAKTTDEVKMMIAGPKAYICNECVDVSEGIIAEQRAADEAAARDATCGKPTPKGKKRQRQ